ncbi:hypothetical protein IC232_18590 [Microvirga sp. BT688]|uniref:hypothetical protein n=1 Tax=Microvirga sp. TaxID=1873136 RepID=UPI0016837BB6|nr:hypothetical protein [Microvirga sp.]MBD2748706.1 hypothetical protein [Microvirga sp.]
MPAPVLWGNQFVIDNEPNNQSGSIKMMALADGGFVGIWFEDQGGLRIRTFNSDGVTRNPEVSMPGETAGNAFDNIEVTLLTDGGYVVSWMGREGINCEVRRHRFNFLIVR